MGRHPNLGPAEVKLLKSSQPAPTNALTRTVAALLREKQAAATRQGECTRRDSAALPRPLAILGEITPTPHRAFCARMISSQLADNVTGLHERMQAAEKQLHKWMEPKSMRKKWSQNFGNAVYCYADHYALQTLCGIQPSRPAGMFGVAVAAQTARESSLGAYSSACLAALFCRRQSDLEKSNDKGSCWGAYGYGDALPGLRSQFHALFPSQLPAPAVARPCGVRRDEPFGVVYMRCGDYLLPRKGHILLRLDWLDGFAKQAFAGVSRRSLSRIIKFVLF